MAESISPKIVAIISPNSPPLCIAADPIISVNEFANPNNLVNNVSRDRIIVRIPAEQEINSIMDRTPIITNTNQTRRLARLEIKLSEQTERINGMCIELERLGELLRNSHLGNSQPNRRVRNQFN